MNENLRERAELLGMLEAAGLEPFAFSKEQLHGVPERKDDGGLREALKTLNIEPTEEVINQLQFACDVFRLHKQEPTFPRIPEQRAFWESVKGDVMRLSNTLRGGFLFSNMHLEKDSGLPYGTLEKDLLPLLDLLHQTASRNAQTKDKGGNKTSDHPAVATLSFLLFKLVRDWGGEDPGISQGGPYDRFLVKVFAAVDPDSDIPAKVSKPAALASAAKEKFYSSRGN